MDIWRDVHFCKKHIQVSYYGEVRVLHRNGNIKVLKPFWDRVGGRLCVKINFKGKIREVRICNLMKMCFEDIIGAKPSPEHVLYRKNGVMSDDTASNLEWIKREKLGKMTGTRSRSKAVAKINKSGEVVEVYSSTREASKKCFLSYTSISNYCNGKNKNKYASDGFAYRWDDDIVYKRVRYEV
jgi:hypothetical protein